VAFMPSRLWAARSGTPLIKSSMRRIQRGPALRPRLRDLAAVAFGFELVGPVRHEDAPVPHVEGKPSAWVHSDDRAFGRPAPPAIAVCAPEPDARSRSGCAAEPTADFGLRAPPPHVRHVADEVVQSERRGLDLLLDENVRPRHVHSHQRLVHIFHKRLRRSRVENLRPGVLRPHQRANPGLRSPSGLGSTRT
jgi:hypothetical protein